MRFDFTKGGQTRYLVTHYGDFVEDKFYFGTYTQAHEVYDSICKKLETGEIAKLVNCATDEIMLKKRG